jgi:hypothetical protein
MRPNIFVSSTIQDLQHLRDAIRDTILELGYNPVMTDYGDVGYLPSVNVEDSCYLSVGECQITVLIIGKRYGFRSPNGLSVTQNEFQASKRQKIPVISLIDDEVLQFKRVFDANPQSHLTTFPGMEDPTGTFSFIHEIAQSSVNNGLIPFSNVSDARVKLKHQLAHLFGDLLRKGFDPVKGEIRDVLSEIKTLRHELIKDSEILSSRNFLRSVRFFLEDSNRSYRELIENLCASLESAIPNLLKSETFDEFIKNVPAHLVVENTTSRLTEMIKEGKCYYTVQHSISTPTEEGDKFSAVWGIASENKIYMNAEAKKIFDSIHANFKKIIDS